MLTVILVASNLLFFVVLVVLVVLHFRQNKKIKKLNERFVAGIKDVDDRSTAKIQALKKEVISLSRSLERWKSSENEKVNIRLISARFRSLEECEKRLLQILEENREEAEKQLNQATQASKRSNLTPTEEREIDRLKQKAKDALHSLDTANEMRKVLESRKRNQGNS